MAPRLVLDTNVLLDLLVFNDAAAAPLGRALADGRIIALRSHDCDAELAEVLLRPQFGLTGVQARVLLDRWQALALPVEHVFAAPWQCTDPRDQKFLDLAHTTRAAGLITKDKAVLKLKRRAARDGLLITTPEHWLTASPPAQSGQSRIAPAK